MTITVTIEELRAYETALIRWGTDRAFYFSEYAGLHPNHKPHERMEVMDAWEKSNPIPKIIPSV